MSAEQSQISPTKRNLSDLGLLYAAAIWGSTFFIVKDALENIDATVMVGYRFLIAGVITLLYLLIRGKSVRAGWGRAFFLSLILLALYLSQTIGLKYTTASNSGFITGLFVFFTPVFMAALFRSKPTAMEWVASIISLLGLWVLTGGLHDINLGDWLTLIAAMAYALHVLYSDRFMKAGVDPVTISAQQFILVGFISLLIGLVFDLPFTIGGVETGLVVLFLALFPTLSAFIIQMFAQRFTTPVKVTLIFALEPVFAALFAWTLGGEVLVEHRAIGGGLIALALGLSGLPLPLKRKQ